MSRLVLTPSEFRILEGLRFSPRKSFHGRVRGERLTKKKGVSIEFDDYREYVEGDDLRHLDWNVLARLEHPVIKTYRDEEDLAVHLLLDTSSSMSFGEPAKLEYAKRLACALGYVALCGGDAVYPRAIGAREQPLPGLRGRVSYPKLARWATSAEPVGTQRIDRDEHQMSRIARRTAGTQRREPEDPRRADDIARAHGERIPREGLRR